MQPLKVEKKEPSISAEEMKQIAYLSALESLLPHEKKYVPILNKLNEFGFSDFEKNKMLAIKHGGEINKILTELYEEDSQPVAQQNNPPPRVQPVYPP